MLVYFHRLAFYMKILFLVTLFMVRLHFDKKNVFHVNVTGEKYQSFNQLYEQRYSWVYRQSSE